MKNKVALITGGTVGIGRATAVKFAQEGAKVMITGRQQAEGEKTVRLIQEAGGDGFFLKSDVAIEGDVKNMVDVCLKQFGRLDFAFNNAGVEGKMAPTVEQTQENFHHVMNINVLGVMLSMKHQIPAMLKNGGGAIVNNASIAGTVGMANGGVYVASKHAVIGLTKSAALEVAKQNIRINSVAPGAIETDMYKRFTGEQSEVREYLKGLHPIGRIAHPNEVATAVVFLCSPNASFITGTNLMVDGGFTAQ